MRLLLTGMTSQQVNPDTHLKRVNFSGLLRDILRGTDDEVYWSEPSVAWDDDYLKQFDHVVVGLAPISSLGANRVYGALSVIALLWRSDKLSLLVDAPDPGKIDTSLQAVVDHPQHLVKEFFSYRKEYRLACERETLDRLLGAVHLLRTRAWKNVIFPCLPWQQPETLSTQLRNVLVGQVSCLNLDHLLFSRFSNTSQVNRDLFWSYDTGSSPSWLSRQGVTKPVTLLPSTFRVPTNDAVIQQLHRSRGTLIGPSKTGTWWSSRYAMSLSQGTPVFSNWDETGALDASWSMLPSGFELLDPDEQEWLGTLQALSYMQAVPSRTEALASVYSALEPTRKGITWMAG